MKIALTEDSSVHDEICVGLEWSSASELFTCSDDQSIAKWIVRGRAKGNRSLFLLNRDDDAPLYYDRQRI